ncbi:nuclear transport factor 2 family protein [Frondihabitans sp. 762G35]|uniref:nuclear transport factor 2 family protein n=1 Tax=Frondihabitans sp. 762G35 TaxID=1446794 RepID=UPI0013D90029
MVGVEAISRAVQKQWWLLPKNHHWCSNLIVTIDGERARGVSDLLVVARFAGGQWIRSGGRYVDTYVHAGDRWLFETRAAGAGFSIDRQLEGFGR